MSDDCVTRVEVVEEVTTKVVVYRGPQGPKGDKGDPGGGGGGGVQVKITIATTLTGISDSVPLATVPSARWLLTITDNTTGEQTHSEIWAGHDGTVVSWTRYGIFSAVTPVPHTVAVVIVGANMELQVTNNSANTITSRAVRFATAA